MSRPISVLKSCTKHFRPLSSTFQRLHHPFLVTYPNRNVVRWQSSPAHIPQAEKKLDVDAILSSAQGADVLQAVTLLKALRVHVLFHGKSQAPNLHEDARFLGLCASLERGCRELSGGALVSGLRSLLELGLSPYSPSVVAAEERLLCHLDRLDISKLVGCLYYHHRFTQSPLQRRVVLALVECIQERSLELTSPPDALLLVPVLHLFPDRAALGERVAHLVPSMGEKELHRLLTAMAQQSLRSVPILRVVASSCLRRGSPDLRTSVDLLYALKKLHFYDPALYGHLLHHLPQEVESCTQPPLISRLLTVCGHLRWRHTGLLDACCRWIQKNMARCSGRELVSYVLATAALHYCSEGEGRALMARVVPRLTEEEWPPSVALDVAWSLAVLDCVPKELLLRVLSKDFYNSLEGESSYSNHLKLLNLKGVLRKEHPECVFGCDLYLEPIKLTESPAIESCRQHVTRVLANLVPKDKCLSQVTDTGVFIDAEFIVNKRMKPLSLEKYGILSKPESTLKKLPPHAKRVSLVVLFQRDLTLSTRVPTGAHALGLRLLANAGYTPVTILYDEFSENKTELQKAKFLLERIKACTVTS